MGKFVKFVLIAAFSIGISTVSANAELPGVTFDDAVLVTPSHALNNYYVGAVSPAKKPLIDMNKRITALATALQNDPVLIYEHIHNNFVVEPRFGLAKGSLGTLLTKSGTPFDLANLAIDLFRSAGLEAEYQLGTISLSANEFGLWFGIIKGLNETAQTFTVDAKYACQFLANGGIPAKVNGAATCVGLTGDLQTVEMLHIWTRVKVNGSWKVFDPSLKTHTLFNGIDLSAAMGSGCALSDNATSGIYSIATDASLGFQSGPKWIKGLNSTEIASNLRQCSIALESTILNNNATKTLEQIFGGKVINEVIGTGTGLSVHPNVISQGSIVSWSGEIPYKYRTKLTVSVEKNSTSVLSYTIYGEDLVGKVMALHVGDSTAPYTGDNIFRIFLDGNIVASTPNTNTYRAYIILDIDHPYAAVSNTSAVEGSYMDQKIQRKTLTFGSSQGLNTLYTIVFGLGLSDPGLMETLDEYSGYHAIQNPGAIPQPPTSVWLDYDLRVQVASSHTNMISAYTFLNNVSYTAKLIERINKVSFQHHHSLGIVSFGSESFMDIDSGLSVADSNPLPNSTTAVKHELTALMSGFEAQALSRPYTYNATSTMPLLAYSSSDITGWQSPANTVYEVDSSNWASIKPIIESSIAGWGNNYIQEFDLINQYVQAGYTVFTYGGVKYGSNIPMDSIPYNNEEPIMLPLGFLAVSADLGKIAHIVGTRKGFVMGVDGYANLQKSLIEKKKTALNQDHFGSKTINLQSGLLGVSLTDIIAGSGPFPYSLPFIRTYKSGGKGSARREDFGDRRCGDFSPYYDCDRKIPWSHNYKIEGFYNRNTAMALGNRRAVDAVDAVIAIYGSKKVLNVSMSLERLMTSFQILNWLMEDMTINAITVNTGAGSASFSEPASLIHGKHMAVNTVTTSMVSGQKFLGPNVTQSSLTLMSTERDGTNDITYARGNYALSDGTIYSIPFIANTGNVSGTFINPSIETIVAYPPVKVSFNNGITIDINMKDNYPPFTIGQMVGYRSYSIVNSIGRSLTIANNTVTTDSGQSVSYVFQDKKHPVNRKNYSDLVSFTDSMANTTTYAYDPDGLMQLKTVTNALSDVVLSVEYDGNERVKSVTDALLNKWTYHIPGSAAAVIDPSGAKSSTYYNNKGWQVRTVDALGRVATSEYDLIGRVIKQTLPEQNYVEFKYDARHNQIKKTAFSKPDPNNPAAPRDTIFIEAGYGIQNYLNPSANYATDINILNWWTDANGNRTDLTYYPNGQIHKVKSPCLNGATSCADSGRPIATYVYTSLGLVDNITDPEGLITKNTYDASANLASTTVDSGGQNLKTVFFYDKHGNLCRTVDPRGSSTQTGGYDATCDQ